jgi:hypothetical protein
MATTDGATLRTTSGMASNPSTEAPTPRVASAGASASLSSSLLQPATAGDAAQAG